MKKKEIIFIIVIIMLILVYSFYICPTSLKVNEYIVKNNKISDEQSGLVIAHFSDLLYKTTITESMLDKIATKINSYNPDIIIFTGDLIYNKVSYTDDDKNELKDFLNNLNANYKKIAVSGDNDNEEFEDLMNAGGFEVIDDTTFSFYYKDAKPIVFTNTNITSNDTYNVLLTHYISDNTDIGNYDLVLTGHSLGGIVKFPLINGIFKKNECKTYEYGEYTLVSTKIYVSNGLGTEKLKLRFNNSPSINIYTLKNDEN